MNGRIRALAVVVVLLLLSVARPVQAVSCDATGSFVFTLGEGAGFLRLFPDGRAEMDLVPGHSTGQGSPPGRTLNGTYRTATVGEQCVFLMDLMDFVHGPINFVGVLAFQGSVLMFQAASVPSFGVGLALRSDTLTGR